MKVDFSPGAVMEIEEARRWYADQQAGLDLDFDPVLAACLDQIVAMPRAGTPFGSRVRKVKLRRFPYAVIYRTPSPGHVRVVAVAHTARRPGYWRGRR